LVIKRNRCDKNTWPVGNRAKLLVASDGYFNCFSKESQLDEMNFAIVPSEMCKRAHIAVCNTFGYKYADNTTIVVLETGNNI